MSIINTNDIEIDNIVIDLDFDVSLYYVYLTHTLHDYMLTQCHLLHPSEIHTLNTHTHIYVTNYTNSNEKIKILNKLLINYKKEIISYENHIKLLHNNFSQNIQHYMEKL